MGDVESTACPICLEFTTACKASPSCCDHVFCFSCLEKWAKEATFCPVDRLRFKSIINLETNISIQVPSKKIKVGRTLYDISTQCEVCNQLSDETILLCDSCDLGFHMSCLSPPMSCIPHGHWFCSDCLAIDRQIRMKKNKKKKLEATSKSSCTPIKKHVGLQESDSDNERRLRHKKKKKHNSIETNNIGNSSTSSHQSYLSKHNKNSYKKWRSFFGKSKTTPTSSIKISKSFSISPRSDSSSSTDSNSLLDDDNTANIFRKEITASHNDDCESHSSSTAERNISSNLLELPSPSLVLKEEPTDTNISFQQRTFSSEIPTSTSKTEVLLTPAISEDDVSSIIIPIKDFVSWAKNPHSCTIPQRFVEYSRNMGDLSKLDIREDGTFFVNWQRDQ